MRIFNRHHRDAPPDAVWVGRGSALGNPFTHLRGRTTRADYQVATRDEAIEAYRRWLFLRNQPTTPT
jgi:hypothetical protein